ncbi:MAG: LysR family transcriptional regulator [Clostridia bacterium]|nr:LysR family transcriptional regulator [Clostridia bacterium]
MNYYQLKYFQAVCTYKTVSAAARYLHISQPSLSGAIRELEKEFGVTLFRRCHHGMELTPQGETLLKLSDDLLSRTEHIKNVMSDFGDSNVLRLGIPPMFGSMILPYIYGSFLKENPNIKLEITEGGRDELIQKLSEDLLDMTFLAHNRPLGQNFEAQNVSKLEIVCCVSKNNPLANRKSVSAAELSEEPLVLFKNSFFQTEEIRKWFALSNVTPNILLQTGQLSTIQTLISHNTAIGFMFRHLIDEKSDFVAISLNTPFFADISLVWKNDAHITNAMKKLSEKICKIRGL